MLQFYHKLAKIFFTGFNSSMKIYAINNQYQNYQNQTAFKGKCVDLDAVFQRLGVKIQKEIKVPNLQGKTPKQIRQIADKIVGNWQTNEKLKYIRDWYKIMLKDATGAERTKILQECEASLQPYLKK
jgi:hypothetical protein